MFVQYRDQYYEAPKTKQSAPTVPNAKSSLSNTAPDKQKSSKASPADRLQLRIKRRFERLLATWTELTHAQSTTHAHLPSASPASPSPLSSFPPLSAASGTSNTSLPGTDSVISLTDTKEVAHASKGAEKYALLCGRLATYMQYLSDNRSSIQHHTLNTYAPLVLAIMESGLFQMEAPRGHSKTSTRGDDANDKHNRNDHWVSTSKSDAQNNAMSPFVSCHLGAALHVNGVSVYPFKYPYPPSLPSLPPSASALSSATSSATSSLSAEVLSPPSPQPGQQQPSGDPHPNTGMSANTDETSAAGKTEGVEGKRKGGAGRAGGGGGGDSHIDGRNDRTRDSTSTTDESDSKDGGESAGDVTINTNAEVKGDGQDGNSGNNAQNEDRRSKNLATNEDRAKERTEVPLWPLLPSALNLLIQWSQIAPTVYSQQQQQSSPPSSPAPALSRLDVNDMHRMYHHTFLLSKSILAHYAEPLPGSTGRDNGTVHDNGKYGGAGTVAGGGTGHNSGIRIGNEIASADKIEARKEGQKDLPSSSLTAASPTPSVPSSSASSSSVLSLPSPPLPAAGTSTAYMAESLTRGLCLLCTCMPFITREDADRAWAALLWTLASPYQTRLVIQSSRVGDLLCYVSMVLKNEPLEKVSRTCMLVLDMWSLAYAVPMLVPRSAVPPREGEGFGGRRGKNQKRRREARKPNGNDWADNGEEDDEDDSDDELYIGDSVDNDAATGTSIPSFSSPPPSLAKAAFPAVTPSLKDHLGVMRFFSVASTIIAARYWQKKEDSWHSPNETNQETENSGAQAHTRSSSQTEFDLGPVADHFLRVVLMKCTHLVQRFHATFSSPSSPSSSSSAAAAASSVSSVSASLPVSSSPTSEVSRPYLPLALLPAFMLHGVASTLTQHMNRSTQAETQLPNMDNNTSTSESKKETDGVDDDDDTPIATAPPVLARLCQDYTLTFQYMLARVLPVPTSAFASVSSPPSPLARSTHGSVSTHTNGPIFAFSPSMHESPEYALAAAVLCVQGVDTIPTHLRIQAHGLVLEQMWSAVDTTWLLHDIIPPTPPTPLSVSPLPVPSSSPSQAGADVRAQMLQWVKGKQRQKNQQLKQKLCSPMFRPSLVSNALLPHFARTAAVLFDACSLTQQAASMRWLWSRVRLLHGSWRWYNLSLTGWNRYQDSQEKEEKLQQQSKGRQTGQEAVGHSPTLARTPHLFDCPRVRINPAQLRVVHNSLFLSVSMFLSSAVSSSSLARALLQSRSLGGGGNTSAGASANESLHVGAIVGLNMFAVVTDILSYLEFCRISFSGHTDLLEKLIALGRNGFSHLDETSQSSTSVPVSSAAVSRLGDGDRSGDEGVAEGRALVSHYIDHFLPDAFPVLKQGYDPPPAYFAPLLRSQLTSPPPSSSPSSPSSPSSSSSSSSSSVSSSSQSFSSSQALPVSSSSLIPLLASASPASREGAASIRSLIAMFQWSQQPRAPPTQIDIALPRSLARAHALAQTPPRSSASSLSSPALAVEDVDMYSISRRFFQFGLLWAWMDQISCYQLSTSILPLSFQYVVTPIKGMNTRAHSLYLKALSLLFDGSTYEHEMRRLAVGVAGAGADAGADAGAGAGGDGEASSGDGRASWRGGSAGAVRKHAKSLFTYKGMSLSSPPSSSPSEFISSRVQDVFKKVDSWKKTRRQQQTEKERKARRMELECERRAESDTSRALHKASSRRAGRDRGSMKSNEAYTGDSGGGPGGAASKLSHRNLFLREWRGMAGPPQLQQQYERMVRDTLPAYLRLTLEYYPELIDARVLTSAYVTVFKHLPEHDLMLLYAVKLLIERTRAVMEEQKAKFVLSRLQRNRISSSSPSSSSMDLKVGGGRGRGGATAVGVGEESASPSAPSASESESFSLSAAEHLFTMTWQLLQLIDISLLDEVLTMIQEELMQQNPSPSSPSSSSVSGVNKGRDDEVVKQANMRVRVALLRVAYKILSSNFDMYRRDICIQWFIDMTVKYSIRRSVFLTVEEGAV